MKAAGAQANCWTVRPQLCDEQKHIDIGLINTPRQEIWVKGFQTIFDLPYRIVLIALVLLSGTMSISVWSQDAEGILNRPNRLAEEQAAWNPKPIPMEEFLNPSIPLKERYPTMVISAPLGGVAYWMDNRYIMIWTGGQKDKETGIATPYLGILDTDTGEVHPYKPGQLKCYWNNRLVYETGPQREARQRKRWAGAPGKEVEIPIFSVPPTDKYQGEQFVPSDLHGCQNFRPIKDNHEKAIQLFGSYTKQSGAITHEVPNRTYWPLLPRHGFFSRLSIKDNPKHEYQKITWFNQDNVAIELDLINFFETDEVQARHWAPFFGKYVLQGSVFYVTFAPGVREPIRWDDYARFGFNTPTFSPLDGTVIRIRKPQYMLEKVQANAVFATRAGMLWIGPPIGHARGYYLSQGQDVKRIFDYEVSEVNTWISPDGCKILSYYDPKAISAPSRLSGPMGALFDFSSTRSGRKYFAVINLCKGE